jgi:hypothetical protein
VSSADFSRLTAIVHTCDRPHGIDRLVKSVGWLYPQLRVLVADDSAKPHALKGADAVKVPAGAGVSASRNALLSRVRTPYVLVLEDTMELSRRSGVDRLLELVAAGKLDIAAGDIIRCQRRFGLFTSRKPDPAHAVFEFESDAMRIIPASRGVNPPGPALKTITILAACGLATTAIGLLWNETFPINKKLWTSSFVMLTGGLAMTGLAACLALFDVAGYRRLARPFAIVGVNAITVYVGAGLLARLLTSTHIGELTTKGWIYQNVFTDHIADPKAASLGYALLNVAVWWLAAWIMARRGWSLRV